MREIVKNDLDGLLRLYMQLQKKRISFYRKAGYNSEDKTAFIQ